MAMAKEYDYLLVGAGLFNAVFAHLAKQHGKRCLIVEKRSHIGGNLYCENIEGICVHQYGPHIFHTDNKKYGTLSIRLSISTDLLFVLWLITMVSSITCLSI